MSLPDFSHHVPSSPVRQFFHQIEAGASRNALNDPSVPLGLSNTPQRCKTPSASIRSTTSPASRSRSANCWRVSLLMSTPTVGKEELKHGNLVVLGFEHKKRRKQRSPAYDKPPESLEHQDVVPPISKPARGYTSSGLLTETNMTALFRRVGHGEGVGYAYRSLGKATIAENPRQGQEATHRGLLPAPSERRSYRRT